jgi:hypothetical protein
MRESENGPSGMLYLERSLPRYDAEYKHPSAIVCWSTHHAVAAVQQEFLLSSKTWAFQPNAKQGKNMVKQHMGISAQQSNSPVLHIGWFCQKGISYCESFAFKPDCIAP